MKRYSTKLLALLNYVFLVVCVFPGCVPIIPTNSIPNPILVSFSVTPSLKVPFSVLTLPSKKSLCFVVSNLWKMYSRSCIYLHHIGNRHNLCTPRFIFPLVRLSESATIIPLVTEPCTITRALQDSKWVQVMQEEYDALIQNSTWTLVPPQPRQNVVGNKWVFRIKQNSNSSVTRYKARLVAKGFHQ